MAAITPDAVLVSRLERLAERADEYQAAAKAEATLRAYRADWKHFSTWASAHGLATLPATPETVAMYLAEQIERTDLPRPAKASTIARRLSSIAQAHRAAEQPNPVATHRVQTVAGGIRRTIGTAVDQAAPVTVAILRRMLTAAPPGLRGTRDRALLLIGFAGALRRSEITGLEMASLRKVDEGLVLTVAKSKGDQEAGGRPVGIPYGSDLLTCPVRAVEAWVQKARVFEGPVFLPVDRHDRLDPNQQGKLAPVAVHRLVRSYARRIGLEHPECYGAHSLRAGFATSAAEAGVSERAIMNQTGHSSLTVMRGYIRRGTLFKDNAAAMVGL